MRAVEVVTSVLRDPLFDRVRLAERAGRCERELPITWKAPDGTLIEGAADLVFEDLTGITVIDFKTDRELAGDLERYRRQLSVYCQALGSLRGTSTRGISWRGSDSGLRAQAQGSGLEFRRLAELKLRLRTNNFVLGLLRSAEL